MSHLMRDYVSLLKGTYRIVSPDGKTTATYKTGYKVGKVILNLGHVMIGNEKEVEARIEYLLNKCTPIEAQKAQEAC